MPAPRLRIAAFIMSVVAVPSTLLASTPPACDVTEKAPVSFRSPTSHETVTVTIRGAPCYKALLSIIITHASGRPLYAYEAEFKQHVAMHGEDPELPERAAAFARRIADDWRANLETTDHLPPWQPEAEFYEAHFNVIKVPKERYEQLRQQRRPVLTHPTHYEQWQSVIYEPSTDQAELLLTGGV